MIVTGQESNGIIGKFGPALFDVRKFGEGMSEVRNFCHPNKDELKMDLYVIRAGGAIHFGLLITSCDFIYWLGSTRPKKKFSMGEKSIKLRCLINDYFSY